MRCVCFVHQDGGNIDGGWLRPLRVTFVGHVYIRPIRDCMNNRLEDSNMRLYREQYYVARRGLTISSL